MQLHVTWNLFPLPAQQNNVTADYPPSYFDTSGAYPMQQYPAQQPGYPPMTDFSAYPPQQDAAYPPQEPPYPTAPSVYPAQYVQ